MVPIRTARIKHEAGIRPAGRGNLVDVYVGLIPWVHEHTARHRSGRFFNFNGTAGIWRRSAISDAGGWQHDTLTEDMDLSYRAQLRGWQFIYLPDVVSPAELPVEMNSFKSQQFRWAKGSIHVAKKLLPAIHANQVQLYEILQGVIRQGSTLRTRLLGKAGAPE